MKWMRRLVASASLVVAAADAEAQIVTAPPDPVKDVSTDWLTKVRFSLGLGQSYFTSNWSGDEVGTISWLAGLDALAAKQMHPKFKLEQTLVLGFGQTHTQDESREFWLAPVKAADKVDYDAFGRFTLGQWLDPYVALTLDSQFYESRPGFGTRYFNPLLLGELAGVSHTYYDTKFRTLVWRFGFGVRERWQRFYGEDPSVFKEMTTDGGFEYRVVGRWSDEQERTEFKSDLYLFQAVYFSESEFDVNDRWRQLDVRWQNSFVTKVYSVISVNLYLDYLYDAQISRGGQFKQTLGLGLTYDLM